MSTKELESLVSCMKTECNAEETAISILNEMAAVEKRLLSSGKPTKDDVAMLRGLAKKVAGHRVNAENTRCMVNKCMKEYTALTKKNIEKTAAKMKEAADILDMLLAKPTAAIGAKKPSGAGSGPAKKPTAASGAKKPSGAGPAKKPTASGGAKKPSVPGSGPAKKATGSYRS